MYLELTYANYYAGGGIVAEDKKQGTVSQLLEFAAERRGLTMRSPINLLVRLS